MKRFLGNIARTLGFEVRRMHRGDHKSPYSRYEELIKRFEIQQPKNMLEVGVWRGDRAAEFLSRGKRLNSYYGFDLFEEMTGATHNEEGMALCYAQPFDKVLKRLRDTPNSTNNIQLVKGYTETTLPQFAISSKVKFDFVFLDGGHSLATIASDWHYVSQLLTHDGVCIFDDYYLEDSSIGCKHLIDSLDQSEWGLDFFRGIEVTIEGHYITMVAVSPQQTA